MKKKENAPIYKRSNEDIIFNIVCYSVFTILAFVFAYPLYYLLINTISSNEKVNLNEVILYPIGINFQNYINVFKLEKFASSMMVSFGRTIIGTGLMLFVTSYTAYLFTKQEMWHRKLWYRFLVVTMYFNAGLIPSYLNLSMLGLTNTFLVYIIPAIVSPYNIILVKTYVESIPGEIEESAFIDGAGYWTIFYKIIWPLSKPILATIAIFGAVGHWNSFQDSLIYNANTPELYTLQHKLYVYLNSSSNLGALMNGATTADANAVANSLNTKVIQYTISMVTIIPIMLVYPFMQRYFEKGIMLGAVKG